MSVTLVASQLSLSISFPFLMLTAIMNLCNVTLFLMNVVFWILPINTRQASMSNQVKIEQSNGMFILRHRSIEELKTKGTDWTRTDDINLDDFSQWSPWSKCRKRCKQVRIRTCNAPSCESTILKEERECTGGRCFRPVGRARTHQKYRKYPTQHQRHQFQRPNKIRVLYHLQRFIYSPWSEWSACKTKTCHTSRYRVCMNSVICQKSIIEENALCYTPGTECEKHYKPNTEQSAPEPLEEIVSENQAISGDQPVRPIDDNECGYMSRHTDLSSMLRIIGGKRTRHGRWPWMVAILNQNDQPYCGGTIISPQFVVTAAHCVKSYESTPSVLRVRAGEHNFLKDDGTEQQVRVSPHFGVIIHPDYDNNTVDNDIALLKLESPLEIDEFVSPICLPSTHDQMALNKTGTILGWGKKRNKEKFGTHILQEARVPIADMQDCKATYSNYQITENMVCAGYKKGKVDSCAGDSGGPLMMRKKDANRRNKWYLYGITSFGEGCGKRGKYGIYAKVPNMVNWIREKVQKN